MPIERCPQCAKRLLQVDAFCPSCRLPLQIVGERFRIERFIATGGFGVVYQARDLKSQSPCVVKVLKQELLVEKQDAQREAFALRFQREIKVTSLLSDKNPHIVGILDHGTAEEYGLFYAMELLEGQTLSRRQHENPLTLHEALHVIRQLCNAIQEAHDHAIVHRDLKPDNVFLIQRENNPLFVKLLDFGIAKTLIDTLNQGLTQGILGTPQYLSPEQCSGEPVTVGSDIYSLGVIAYELLTGLPLFKGDSALALVQSHIARPPTPPSERRPELHLPKALDAVILKALEKSPDVRYSSAWEFWEGLAPYADIKRGITMRSQADLPAAVLATVGGLDHTMGADLDDEGPTDLMQAGTPAKGPRALLSTDAENTNTPASTLPYTPNVLPELAILETVDGPEKLGAFISNKDELPAPLAMPMNHALEDLALMGDIDEVLISQSSDSSEGISVSDDSLLPSSYDDISTPSKPPVPLPPKPAPSTEQEPSAQAAPSGSRAPLVFAGVGGLALVALLAWLFVPGLFGPGRPSSQSSAFPGSRGGALPTPRRAPSQVRKTPTKRTLAVARQVPKKPRVEPPARRRVIRKKVARRRSPRRVSPRRKIRRQPARTRPKLPPRRVAAPGSHPICGPAPAGKRWVFASLVKPKGERPQLSFRNCRSCRITRRNKGFCLSLPDKKPARIQVRADGYQFCTHSIAATQTRIRWYLRIDDPDRLATAEYKCFR